LFSEIIISTAVSGIIPGVATSTDYLSIECILLLSSIGVIVVTVSLSVRDKVYIVSLD